MYASKSEHERGAMMAIVVKGPYNKRCWGTSGHPDDIEIVTMIQVMRIGHGWHDIQGKLREYKLSYLRKIAEVISEGRRSCKVC